MPEKWPDNGVQWARRDEISVADFSRCMLELVCIRETNLHSLFSHFVHLFMEVLAKFCCCRIVFFIRARVLLLLHLLQDLPFSLSSTACAPWRVYASRWSNSAERISSMSRASCLLFSFPSMRYVSELFSVLAAATHWACSTEKYTILFCTFSGFPWMEKFFNFSRAEINVLDDDGDDNDNDNDDFLAKTKWMAFLHWLVCRAYSASV